MKTKFQKISTLGTFLIYFLFSTGLFYFSCQADPITSNSPQSNTNELLNLISSALTANFPTNNAKIVGLEATAIASDCSGATNSELLYAGLSNEFCRYGLTNGSVPFTNVAISIEQKIFPPEPVVGPTGLGVSSQSNMGSLSDVVSFALITDYPKNNAQVVGLEATAIASDCSGATNSELLYAGLSNGFCLYGLTNGSVPFTNIAMTIASTFNGNISELTNFLLFAVIVDYPANNAQVGALEANTIASECSSATNSELLYAGLSNGFCLYGLTNGSVSFTNIAESIVELSFGAAISPTQAAQEQAVASTNLLVVAIIKNLTNNFPTTDMTNIEQEAPIIASKCSALTNTNALFNGLTNALYTDVILNLGTNSTLINQTALAIADEAIANPEDTVVQELESFDTNLDRLGSDLTVAADALSTTNNIIMVGRDLCTIGGEFSQIVTFADLTNKLAVYLTVTNTTNSLENDLSTLETDMSQTPKTPSAEQVRTINKILKKSGKSLLTIKDDIATTNTASLPGQVGGLGSEITLLGVEALGPVPPQAVQALFYGPPAHDMTMIDTNETQRWNFAFSVGAQLSTPYTVSVPTGATGTNFGTLSNKGNNTVAYFQLELMNHWVLAPAFSQNPANNFLDGFTFMHPEEANWSPDYDLTLGFLLGNSSSASNGATSYSAQTLAGSDIYMQAGLGLPIWRNNWQCEDTVPVELLFGGSVGVTTDLQFERIHPNEFYGGMLDIGLPTGILNTTNNTGLVQLKMGMGHIEVPNTTGTGNEVYLDNNGLPEFKGEWAPQMGVRALVPIGGQVYLDLEADAYFSGNPPNQWDVKVGATIPLSSLGNLLSFLGSSK